MSSMLIVKSLIGIVVGGLGGAASAALVEGTTAVGTLAGALFGLLFALLAARRAVTLGSGLLWGLGYSFLLWIMFPAGIISVVTGQAAALGMADAALSHFPELVAYILCFGVPLGLTIGASGTLQSRPEAETQVAPFSFPRAIVFGGFAGVIGRWALAQGNFFLLIAGLVHSESMVLGVTLHFLFALIIGATFGVLFQADVRGYGSSMSWGAAYGFVLGVIWPFTVLYTRAGER